MKPSRPMKMLNPRHHREHILVVVNGPPRRSTLSGGAHPDVRPLPGVRTFQKGKGRRGGTCVWAGSLKAPRAGGSQPKGPGCAVAALKR